MKYLIAILLLTGSIYSQCNKDNWEDYYNSDGRDMSGCDLEGANLQSQDLSGSNLTGADLTGADLWYANLRGADLSDANLSGVRSGQIIGKPASLPDGWFLINGYLIGPDASLSDANLSGENLTDANLSWANLTGANLYEVILDEVDLSYANLCNLTTSPSGDVCEQPDGITDENEDGYDDVSYEIGYENGATSGDLNLDGINNVLDIVTLVNQVLGG